MAGLSAYVGLVRDGDGVGPDSVAGADDLCTRSRGSAAGTNLVFPGFELCCVGQRLDVSAHPGRPGRMLCGCVAVLSQRPDLDGYCCRSGVWGSGAGAAAEWGARTDCAGGEVAVRWLFSEKASRISG